MAADPTGEEVSQRRQRLLTSSQLPRRPSAGTTELILTSEWTESLGFAEGLHSSGDALAQQEPRGCGSLWGLRCPAAPAHFSPERAWGWALLGSAREKERQQVICRSLGGSDYGDEALQDRRCK